MQESDALSSYFPEILLNALQLFLRSKGLLNNSIDRKYLHNEIVRIAWS
jgi:hypothetical protein